MLRQMRRATATLAARLSAASTRSSYTDGKNTSSPNGPRAKDPDVPEDGASNLPQKKLRRAAVKIEYKTEEGPLASLTNTEDGGQLRDKPEGAQRSIFVFFFKQVKFRVLLKRLTLGKCRSRAEPHVTGGITCRTADIHDP